jgi:hypothetical protein
MFLLILLIIALYSLFAFLCYWHYNLVKSSEVKGDKEKFCKIVRIVLIFNAVSVLLCFMTVVSISYRNRIHTDIFLKDFSLFCSSIYIFLCFPLAIGSYIWMIINEILQIKDKKTNKKNLYLLLSLILITVAGFFLYCIGALMCMVKF